MIPSHAPQEMVSRPLDAMALVRLRDIGPNARIGPSDRLLTVSPDGRWAAFQLRRAHPWENRYCLAMVAIDLQHPSVGIMLDRGGELIQIESDIRGVAAKPSGIPRPISPRWSPDGHWIAFLKRTDGVTRLWRAEADGSGSQVLVSQADDIVDFRFSPDGHSILFMTRPQLRQARAEIEEEGRSGYVYDARFVPEVASHPRPLADDHPLVSVFHVMSAKVDPASPEQTAWFHEDIAAASSGRSKATSDDGRRASLVDMPGDFFAMDMRIEIMDGPRTAICDQPDCKGRLLGLWWTPDGRRLRYLRQEGWGFGEMAIYEWDPVGGQSRRLFATQDQLADCTAEGERLLCLDDGAATPRRIVTIDPETGRMDVLFDPNPEFTNLRLGRVERLRWKNRFGLETYGDLVYPVGYRPGRRYPLIVVQYDSRGFLRGGTGDEYPIQAFANRGYAVLSFQRPLDIGIVREPHDMNAAQVADLKHFADRRSVLSALERGVRLVIARGVADPRRVGITGMSDGSTTVQFALLHSHLFAAAAISNCCVDRVAIMLAGPGSAQHFRDEGFPSIGQDHPAFWQKISLGPNVRAIRTPILMQLPDDEYLGGLETYTALQEAQAPVSLYVFPDEHHVKWQPAHRLAIYERSLDWFDYWLKSERSADRERADDLTRWDGLRNGSDHRAEPPA
jgi:dipeptidyl aminopeptidase/acylaminoacyl peptidase